MVHHVNQLVVSVTVIDDRAEAAWLTGSSPIRWGSRGECSCGQQHSEPVVLAVAVAAGEAAVQLDDSIDGFGTAVVGPAGGEVGQERVAPFP